MKTRTLLLLSFIIIVISSCTKEEAENIECESENIGYVTITNTSENPYLVYIDEILVFTLQGNTFMDDYELSAGSHDIKAEQESGYLIYPTIVESSLCVGQCQKLGWVFP